MPAPDTADAAANGQTKTTQEAKEIADRKLNIEKMMEELDAMKAKKQALIARNSRLIEN